MQTYKLRVPTRSIGGSLSRAAKWRQQMLRSEEQNVYRRFIPTYFAVAASRLWFFILLFLRVHPQLTAVIASRLSVSPQGKGLVMIVVRLQ